MCTTVDKNETETRSKPCGSVEKRRPLRGATEREAVASTKNKQKNKQTKGGADRKQTPTDTRVTAPEFVFFGTSTSGRQKRERPQTRARHNHRRFAEENVRAAVNWPAFTE